MPKKKVTLKLDASLVREHPISIEGKELYPAIAKAKPITYALLVPQSPYRIAAALAASTFLGLFVFPTIIC